MEKILIYIKHHLAFLWRMIEHGNGWTFILIYKSRLAKILEQVFREVDLPPFHFRRLSIDDASALRTLIVSQNPGDLEYFKPHGFDELSIKRQYKYRSFIMMGAFDRDRLVGYFFLRFFTNRKCFVGRLIDQKYRGKGIGLVMNDIMYQTAWRMGFRCLSTISKNNAFITKAHARNDSLVILKELQNEYMLVEFLKKENN